MSEALKLDFETELLAAASAVLETMFFSEIVERQAEPPEDGLLVTRVRFHGLVSGTLQVWISAGLMPQLAAGFLGLDESEVEESHTRQVLCELSNMICGSALSHVNAESTFALAPPEIVCEAAMPGTVWTAIDGGSLGMRLVFEPD